MSDQEMEKSGQQLNNEGDNNASSINSGNNSPAGASNSDSSLANKDSANSPAGADAGNKPADGKEGQEGQEGEGLGNEGKPQDPSSSEAIRARMDIDNHPDVKSGEVPMDSEKDKEFRKMLDERIVLPSHESQDGVRNKENRSELKDAGIKRKGFNNDLHKLNIERVVEKKGGKASLGRRHDDKGLQKKGK